MKRPLLLFAILLSLFPLLKPEKASAQITGVSISIIDSYYTTCTLPNSTNLSLYGDITGTAATPDSVSIYLNTGDGFDTTFFTPIYTSGGSAYYYSYLSHVFTIPGAFTPYATVTATGGATASTSSPTFTLSDDCASLSGKLYVDANGNCAYDAGEVELAYIPIMIINTTLSDTTFGWWTDGAGNYSVNLAPGYSYNIIPNSYLFGYWWWGGYVDSNITPSCPTSGSYAITPTGGSTTTENFAYTCIATMDSFDAMAAAWTWGFVPGDTSTIYTWGGDWWWYSDYTCTDLSSTVTLTLDPMLTYVGVVPGYPAPTVSGSTLTWTASTISDFFDFYSGIRVVTPTSATLGDNVCNTLYVSPTSLPDPNLANNTYNFCVPVTSSFDPNGIEVSPVGTGVPGYIAANLPMSYNIHFQNTGTATATNITVVDTISSNLDVSTLHILKSSAPVEISNVGNVVKFRFSSINLPDSISSPLGSIGTVSYGILQKQNLAPGTQIKSTASIYFDYNAPVKTNTTLNTIQVTTGVKNVSNSFKAAVYPNPANEEVTVQSADKTDFSVSMMDMLGRTMAANTSTQGNVIINTHAMPAGMYLVKITDNKGNEVSTKVNVQH